MTNGTYHQRHEIKLLYKTPKACNANKSTPKYQGNVQNLTNKTCRRQNPLRNQSAKISIKKTPSLSYADWYQRQTVEAASPNPKPKTSLT
jgi:hypothetical protein